MTAVFIISWFILEKTSFGIQVRAVGGNKKAAKLSGIKVNMVIFICFCIAAVLAVLGGFILTGRMNSASSSLAMGSEMDVIAAVVIGGTSMGGAEGTIWGTLIGAMLMGVLRNGLNLLGIDSFWQQIAMGVVVILAVTVDALRSRSRDNA
jgi:ribose/xylose/arabinose/galactoside ABC-type transport system permease subunit